jgi:hypothetical protein
MTEARGARPGLTTSAAAHPEPDQALVQLLQRVEAVLDEEQKLLAENRIDQLERLIGRKDQLALELSRLHQQAASGILGEGSLARLRQASTRLGRNAALLERHIAAVSDITTLISGIIADASGDGTYSSVVARPVPRG